MDLCQYFGHILGEKITSFHYYVSELFFHTDKVSFVSTNSVFANQVTKNVPKQTVEITIPQK